MTEEKYTGALIDDRSSSEKEKDYRFEEMVASSDVVNWQEKDIDDWKEYPISDQDGSGSCVAQTASLMLGIMHGGLSGNGFVPFSATHIYQRRKNKPSGGMNGIDCGDIVRQGVTLETLVPSQDMNDSEMDRIEIAEYKKRVGEVFKPENYVLLPTADIDVIASTIQKTGKPVMVWYYFKHSEWKKEMPEVQDTRLNRSNASRHSVTAIDYFLHKGKKCLLIQDSWGVNTGIRGRRIITEDFHTKRNWFALYFLDFKFAFGQQPDNKPKYFFTETMRFSTKVTYSMEVKALQNCLKYEGFFPTNIESTGYFGAITKKAVINWQKKHNLVADGIIGRNSRSVLNRLYA